jgi:glyoxylase-like metal-dependent hydrolase (beta-lactamase superfamily II)
MEHGLPEYELYAIRYATRAARRSNHFIMGDPHDAPMDMDYYVWLAVGPQRTFLIDLGFSAETAARRKRDLLRCPIEALRLLDIDPASIKDAIITHLHYDHAGNFKLVPAAQFHLQEPEIHFAVGRHIRHRHISPNFEVEDIVDVVRLNYARRVTFYNGQTELAPGLWLEPTPGHSPGQQAVRVHTQRGWVVLASDACHFYENIQDGRPFPAIDNVSQALESCDKVMAMAGDIHHVIPGHDPLVLAIYPAARQGLEGVIARLDVPPDTDAFAAYRARLAQAQ